MHTWTICYADREYAKELGDPDLGQVETDNFAEAVSKAEKDPHISSNRHNHTAALWAYVKRD